MNARLTFHKTGEMVEKKGFAHASRGHAAGISGSVIFGIEVAKTQAAKAFLGGATDSEKATFGN
jgi:hypothetical protein